MRKTGPTSWLCILALCFGLCSGASALVISDTFANLEASISVPDSIAAGQNFNLDVSASLIGGSSFDIYAYALYEGAIWSYDANHRFQMSAGTLIEEDTFNFGNSFSESFVLNLAAGDYAYTFVFGDRTSSHNSVDLAVDINFTVVNTMNIPEPVILSLMMAGLVFLALSLRASRKPKPVKLVIRRDSVSHRRR